VSGLPPLCWQAANTNRVLTALKSGLGHYLVSSICSSRDSRATICAVPGNRIRGPASRRFPPHYVGSFLGCDRLLWYNVADAIGISEA